MQPDIGTKIIILATLISNILYVHGFNLQAVGARRKYIDIRSYNFISILVESAQVVPTLHKKWKSLLIDYTKFHPNQPSNSLNSCGYTQIEKIDG